MSKRNLMLGYGENLVSDLPSPTGHGGEKNHPYVDIDEVYARLCPEMNAAFDYVSNLDEMYCPDDNAVFRVALHPAYLAKSYFPGNLFARFGLRVIGSRFEELVPQKALKGREGISLKTMELYVAGPKAQICELTNHLKDPNLFEDVRKIERIRAFIPHERIMGDNASLTDARVFELVLHSDRYDDSIVRAFASLSEKFGAEPIVKKRVQTAGLCFLPLRVKSIKVLDSLEPFAFLRLMRKMPRLRGISREIAGDVMPLTPIQLPPCPSGERNVAVFDVGCEVSPRLNGWIRGYNLPNRLPGAVLHGTMVNSALLFGSIKPGQIIEPICPLDSYQVIDPNDTSNEFELYEALERICQILDTHNYEFVNLSIGPDLPISDNEIHAWTAKLDEKLASGHVLMSVAVGNNGEMDENSGNARIEVPSDSVNALSVGASTDFGDSSSWDKTSYSAIGPGRMPGRRKPDVLDFGGCQGNPFGIVDPVQNQLMFQMGTSFAAPNALRKCVALRQKYPELRPLAIKAIVIHSAINHGNDHSYKKHGYGALPANLDRFVVCADNEMTVVYQGRLEPRKYVKALIPVPEDLQGRITIKATLCYATNVDSETPGNYTRSAIEVKLRPDISKMTGDMSRPKTKPFFASSKYSSEVTLRECGKWDTVMHDEITLDADKSIERPFFEMHYMAREGVNYNCVAEQMPYAFVVTVKAPKTPNLYESVVALYQNKIRPLVEVGVPIDVQVF